MPQEPPADADSEAGPDARSNVIPFPSHRIGAGAQAADASTGQPSLPGMGAAVDAGDAKDTAARQTILSAELRGWTAISERIGPSQAEHSLSGTIDQALAALAEWNASDVTIEGDAMQPAITCTFEGSESPARAVRAAVDLRRAIAEAQSPSPAEHQFRVGMGLDSGDVLRAITEDDVAFESVGPIRMFAAKLRDFAGAGQIFMSVAVYLDVRDVAHVQSLGEVRLNAYGETREAFSLTDLSENS